MPANKGRAVGPRELIRPNNDARYIRRDAKGRIVQSTDVSRSRSIEARQASAGKRAQTKVKPGYGDRGDVKKRK